MNNKTITELISSFNEQSGGVKESLTALLDVVKEGRVPSADAMLSLDSSVDELRTTYDAIYETARGSVPSDELPENDAPVSAIEEALKNNRSRFLEEQLERAKATLAKFIRVKALIDNYASALAPYQTAAASVIEELSEETVEMLLPKTEAPELFLKVMEQEDIQSPQSLQLLGAIPQHFPEQFITIGLVTKQFYLDEAADRAVEADEAPVTVDVPAATEKAEEMSAEAVEERESVKTMCPVLNAVKVAVPSASTFKKEPMKFIAAYPECDTILPLFTNLGVMTKEQIFTFGCLVDCFEGTEEKRAAVYDVVDKLTEKGYLAMFSPCDGLTLYCLSSYCSGCLHKESIRQLRIFDISIGNVKFAARNEVCVEDALRFFGCNVTLIQYLQGVLAETPECYQKVKESITWNKDHYQIDWIVEDEVHAAYLVGVADEDGVQELDLTAVEAEYIVLSRDDVERMTVRFGTSCRHVVVATADRLFVCDPQQPLTEQIRRQQEELPAETVTYAADEPSEAEETVAEYPTTAEEEAAADVSAVAEEAAEEETDNAFEEAAEDAAVETSEVIEDATEEAVTEEAATEEVTTEDVVAEEAATEEVKPEEVTTEGTLTPQSLLALGRTPTAAEFADVIHTLLSEPVSEEQLAANVVQAVLLARGIGLIEEAPDCNKLSAQVRLATALMPEGCRYVGEFMDVVFDGATEETPALVLAAYMYALLVPGEPYDYNLKVRAEQLLADFGECFGDFAPFKPLFMKLIGVREKRAGGFTPAVVSSLGDESEVERSLAQLRREASFNTTVPAPKTRIKALPTLYHRQFGVGSDLLECMKIIAGGNPDSDSLGYVGEVLEKFCDKIDNEYQLNEEKIGDVLNDAWDEISPDSRFKLSYDARDLALRQYRQRLTVMIKWFGHFTNMENKKDLEHLKAVRKDILTEIRTVSDDTSWQHTKDANALRWMLTYMERYLTDNIDPRRIYADLLYTGVFSLSESGFPDIDESFASIKYYEVWRNALRHIVAPRRPIEDVVADILGETSDGDAGLKDNLHQLSMIGAMLGSEDDIYVVSKGMVKEASESADIRTERFKDSLELAYTYYQINETEKENLASIMAHYKSAFYDREDFAAWRRFLEALEKQVEEFGNGRKKGLRSRLSAHLAEDGGSALLREAERLLEEESNFAVTEEYLNRYEAGERELDDTVLFDKDYFTEFLMKETYDPLLQECQRCKGKALKHFGWNYLEKRLPETWTRRLLDDSKMLIQSWPTGRDRTSSDQVRTLLKGLGFTVINATRVNGRREEMWNVEVKPTARSLDDYLHPIAAFGTQMKSPLQVIFLYGNYTEQQLVDTITSMNLGTMSLVFIDRPIEAAQRRLIGEIFHTQKTGQNPFLLIDQVLFLYLAMNQETERLPAMLKCTLPYATYQPFVRDGGPTADEMFCGRKMELETIINPNGASVVYGGRQLGKTALLERAESRCSKPEKREYAVYSTIIRLRKEADVVHTLIRDIERKTNGKIALKPCDTLRDMCYQIEDLFRSGDIVKLYLLIDEVDDFLDEISADKYHPMDPLVNLKRATGNHFKFVIAGLHNVCRMKNATADNGVFGQLGTPLCIKPLSPTDALQLLSRPLRYLGFQIDRYPHLETILTNTNYYPGILQFFGYILVETLTGQYAKYYRAVNGNPPFKLRNEQLGAVMNSADLNKSIKDKFRWSLELDPRYFMIARCITMLYHLYEDDRSSGSWRGFRVEDVMEIAENYSIHCLETMSKHEYAVLMDEMVEMGILGKAEESADAYRLRRNSFVDIIGESIDSVDEDIKTNNEEG